MSNWLALSGRGMRGNAGTPIAIVSPTPTPSPSSAYPSWFTLGPIPTFPAAFSTQTATVNPSNFAATLAGLTGNEGTLYCAGGTYSPSWPITKVVANNMVRFAAADPNDPPIFSNTSATPGTYAFGFSGASNLWFDGWVWDTPNITAYFQIILQILSCSNIRISRGWIRGGADTTYTTPRGLGKAMMIKGSDRVFIDGVDFRRASYGIIVQHDGTNRSSNIYVGYNNFSDRTNGSSGIALDSINIGGVTKMVIERNFEWNKHWLSNDLHPDLVQFLANDGTQPAALQYSDNVIMRRNCALNDNNSRFVDNNGALYSQHGFVSDGIRLADMPTASPYPYTAIIYDDNDYMGTGNWAARFESTQYGLAQNNRFKKSGNANYVDDFSNPMNTVIGTISRTYGGNPNQVPNCDNITIQNNSCSQIVIASDSTNVTQSGNTTDTTGYTDAQFYTVKNAWLAARAALYNY